MPAKRKSKQTTQEPAIERSTVSATPRPSDKPNTKKNNNKNNLSVFLVYAILAGVCAAASGICTKVGVSSAARILVSYLVFVARFAIYGMEAQATSTKDAADENRVEQIVEVIVRVTMIASNAILTAQMWRYLIKASDLAPTPMAHGVVTATNLAVSALVGVFVLGEAMPGPIWAAGAVVTSVGLYLLLSDEQERR